MDKKSGVSKRGQFVSWPTIRTRYLMLADLALVLLAFLAGIWLRYESLEKTTSILIDYWLLMLVAAGLQVFLNYFLGLYARMWRYASLPEVRHIIQTTIFNTTVVAGVNWLALPLLGRTPLPSLSVWVLVWGLSLVGIGATRLVLRVGLNWLVQNRKRNVLQTISPHRHVLIAGAGDMGAVVARLIKDNPEMAYDLVGFVDDDPLKQDHVLCDRYVLGNRSDIPRLAREYHIDEVIVAMSTAPQNVIDDIYRLGRESGLCVRIIPSIYDLVSGSFDVSQLRQWRSYQHAFVGDGAFSQNGAKEKKFKVILVTGGAGFIGSNFARYMLQTYPNNRIIVFDKLTYAGNLDNLCGLEDQYGERYVFVQGDIADYEAVIKALKIYQVDGIVNFAAESHVDRSLLDPDAFLRTNVQGTYVLLKAAREIGIKRFHQVSTDEVYGQVIRGSFSEQDPLETRSPYSASKAAADLLVHAYHNSFGLSVTITRGSNNIGPYQYPEKVVPLFVTNALDNLPLPVYGDGFYIRDYQYVLDHCRGIDIVLHKGVPGEVYNLGGGPEHERTALEVARAILDRLGKPHSLICLVKDRQGQDRRYSMNCSKIMALGWKPEWPFDKALDATVQWYVENEWWWRKIKRGEYRKYYEKQFNERLIQATQSELTKRGVVK